MHTVAILSLKGGVGKTTVALGLASAARRRSLRTLVIDLDPQGNATASLDPAPPDSGLADVLDTPRSAVVHAAITSSSWNDDLDVLVGSADLDMRNEAGPGGRRLDHLSVALDELHAIPRGGAPYDLVILDCPPSLGRLARSALVAADAAVLVTEPTMYSVTGAQRGLEAIEKVRQQHNPELRPAGVVVNRLRLRSYEHQFRVAELRESFGQLIMPTAIPDRIAVQQAQGACTPIHEWNTPGAAEIALAFNMILARILRSERAGRHRIAQHTPDTEHAAIEPAPTVRARQSR